VELQNHINTNEMNRKTIGQKSLLIPSIDSFKWKIELDKVDILNRNLLDHIISIKTNSATGEVLEEKPIQANSLQIQFNNYNIHFAINKMFGVEYLIVLINSKLLEENYLSGISQRNIESIYNQLMDCKVFECSYPLFLDGIVSDIDIKKDLEVDTTAEFDSFTKQLELATLPNRKSKQGCNRFQQKSNKGIEWNSRVSSSYSKPFLKIYHKGVESMNSKNHEFFNTYLDLETISKRIRIECTMKSKEEMIKHNIKGNRLRDLMSADVSTLNDVLIHSITSNLIKRVPPTRTKTKNQMSPQDLALFILLTNMIKDQKYDFETTKEYILGFYDDKFAKTRMKRKLTEIYESQIQGRLFEIKTQKMNDLANAIGWK
jgi:hypothetical protein